VIEASGVSRLRRSRDIFGVAFRSPCRRRGRSAFSFLEQAAQDAAVRTFGDLRIEAYEPVQSGRMTERSWEVLLADPPGQVRVELAQTYSEPVYSNCAATVALPRPAFTVQSISRTR
jgi:hypothetical protein